MAALQLTYAHKELNNTQHAAALYRLPGTARPIVSRQHICHDAHSWLTQLDRPLCGLSESLPCMTGVAACAMYSSSQWPLPCEAAVMAPTTRADAADMQKP